ncbi:MAG: efflux transporter periplasmic adaptor subunit [Gammaproteobacteria bacterium]|nr:efflux transporter periplasmic adaptor subunit [Gammaproteobacteria bacterium]
MRGTYITATVIALLIGAWLLSGQFGEDGPSEHPTLAEENRQRQAQTEDDALTRVRARVIQAVPQVQNVVLRGRTENKRTVAVKAETAGRVVERPVDRGTAVSQGDVLCRISVEDREAGLAEARAALEQARIEHQASLKLKEQGFQSETAIAQARARLAAAEAQVERREIDLARTAVRAPFAGVVEDVLAERGDYLTPGATCVTIVDMDPMLLVGRVSEREVSRLEPGQNAEGHLTDGRIVSGPITFVGQQADPATRTYAVEVEVPNPERALRSGITTEIRIPVDRVMAHKVSPALFSLDDDGNVGIRTVNDQGRVEYHPIRIVRDDVDGVWVTGLPEVATLITVGQELVVPGQEVELSFEPAGEMPAKATDDDPARPSSSKAVGTAGTEAMVRIAAKP